MPETNPWDNPLENANSGFYLNPPANLQPQLEYDPESKLYSVEQKINGFRLSTPTFLSAEEYDNTILDSLYQNIGKKKLQTLRLVVITLIKVL